MGFSRQEHWRGFPFPPPGGLPSPGIEPTSAVLQADSLPLSHPGSQKEPDTECHCLKQRQTMYFPSGGGKVASLTLGSVKYLGVLLRSFLPKQVALMVKNLPANAGDERDACSVSGWGRSPGGGNSNPAPLFLPEKFHRQRSLAGHSPGDLKELDTAEGRDTRTAKPPKCIKQVGPTLCMPWDAGSQFPMEGNGPQVSL